MRFSPGCARSLNVLVHNLQPLMINLRREVWNLPGDDLEKEMYRSDPAFYP